MRRRKGLHLAVGNVGTNASNEASNNNEIYEAILWTTASTSALSTRFINGS